MDRLWCHWTCSLSSNTAILSAVLQYYINIVANIARHSITLPGAISIVLSTFTQFQFLSLSLYSHLSLLFTHNMLVQPTWQFYFCLKKSIIQSPLGNLCLPRMYTLNLRTNFLPFVRVKSWNFFPCKGNDCWVAILKYLNFRKILPKSWSQI